jgi:hypothetical protein
MVKLQRRGDGKGDPARRSEQAPRAFDDCQHRGLHPNRAASFLQSYIGTGCTTRRTRIPPSNRTVVAMLQRALHDAQIVIAYRGATAFDGAAVDVIDAVRIPEFLGTNQNRLQVLHRNVLGDSPTSRLNMLQKWLSVEKPTRSAIWATGAWVSLSRTFAASMRRSIT